MSRAKADALPRLLTAGIVGGVVVALLAFFVRSCTWARTIQNASDTRPRWARPDTAEQLAALRRDMGG